MISYASEQDRLDYLRRKADALPLRPGVYLMMNKQETIIYVGKSRALRNRVSQYFHGDHDIKTSRMASQVHDFQFIVCDTEMEALALENRLIKQHTPRYNIRLKDAKSYPYIKINLKSRYPRLTMTRTRVEDGSLYFGPYSGVAAVYSLIGMMEKTFGLPTCKRHFPADIGRERPCIYYQTGRCVGICTGNVSEEEYQEVIRRVVDVLKGDTSSAIARATERMMEASEDMRFEEAARLRDSIAAMKKLGEKQKAVGAPSFSCDLFALAENETGAAMTVFFVRGGYISDTQHFLFGKDEIYLETQIGENGQAVRDSSPLVSVLLSLYESRVSLPREILLSFSLEPSELETLTAYLESRTNHKITIHTPQRGALRQLCSMAVSDAEKHLENELSRNVNEEKMLASLAGALQLEVLPSRIECYDVSSYGNEQITCGMVVAKDGRFSKKDYRLFKMKEVSGQDDYASMREAVLRRLDHLSDQNGSMCEMPDLILLDGGRGHVGVIRAALAERGMEIPVFGLVKDEHHKTRTVCSDVEEISVARDMQLFRFLYGLQEEVHRFTVGSMDRAKRKTLKTSSLEKIPGIGPKKAKKLLSHFGTLDKIKKASVEELQAVKGFSQADAENTKRYFAEEPEKR